MNATDLTDEAQPRGVTERLLNKQISIKADETNKRIH